MASASSAVALFVRVAVCVCVARKSYRHFVCIAQICSCCTFIALYVFFPLSFFFCALLLQTSCSLSLFNMTDENIIISARLPHDSKVNPLELLRKEKVSAETCEARKLCSVEMGTQCMHHHIGRENVELCRRRRCCTKHSVNSGSNAVFGVQVSSAPRKLSCA